VSESQRASSVGLLSERFVPILGGLACFFANIAWLKFVLTDHSEWGNRLLDRVILASSVGVAFWGIAITLLIGMESKPIVENLKRLRYFGIVVRYFSESLFATLLLLLMSVLLEPLSKEGQAVLLSSVWVGLGAWTLMATVRAYLVLTKMLSRMD
jgi:hypothetical protein